MFEHRNPGKNRKKRSEIFRKFVKGIKGFDSGKKTQNYLMLVYLQNDHGEKSLQSSQKGRKKFFTFKGKVA
jgi:hypothetical protein